MTQTRGPYLGENRVLEIERRIAAVEGALTERIRRLEADVASLRRTQVAILRSQATALLEILQELQGPRPERRPDQ